MKYFFDKTPPTAQKSQAHQKRLKNVFDSSSLLDDKKIFVSLVLGKKSDSNASQSGQSCPHCQKFRGFRAKAAIKSQLFVYSEVAAGAQTSS